MLRVFIRYLHRSLSTKAARDDHHAERVPEYMLAWMMLGWGVAVLMPGDIFVGPQYSKLLLIMPEPAWGVLACGAGALRLGGLIINGAWRRSPLLRLTGATFGLCGWLSLYWLYLWALRDGAEPFPMINFLPVMIIFEGYACYRCAQDARWMNSFALPAWTKGTRTDGGD